MENLAEVIKKDNTIKENIDWKRLNTIFFVIYQMACLSRNMTTEAAMILQGSGKYRYEIKHNFNEISRLLEKTYRGLFGKLSEKQLDDFSQDADSFEKMVYSWANLPEMFSGLDALKKNEKNKKKQK